VPGHHHCHCGPFRVDMVPHGLLKPYILRLLLERPRHGFEIMEEMYERTQGLWRPGPSVIYPTLESLESDGYIEAIERPGAGEKAARPYRLTRKGREALKNFDTFRADWTATLSQLEEIWE
jgi:DNA-binding PadR family transcriptional regulator